jgi:nitroreductase
MDFLELVRARYSVRSYRPDPVEEEKLAQVLEAGVLAPTAANKQAFRILVVRTRAREAELRRIYDRDWFVSAPIVLCVCGLPGENWVRSDGKNYNDVDAAIVMDHIVMAATDLGLGTCWIGAFDPDGAREVLGLPAKAEPVAFTPLGYPADRPGTKKRKATGQLVMQDRWTE